MILLVALAAVAINAFRPSHTKIVDIKLGTGPAVKTGDTVSVHYVGKLANGKVFDESKSRGLPFDVGVGRGMVIKGWDVGLVGMQAGGVRKLVIPPDEAYGAKGVGPIPPNSTLYFEVELIGIK
jgi:FKBP-type peptidyl-prolyl cis-trans isomerase